MYFACYTCRQRYAQCQTTLTLLSQHADLALRCRHGALYPRQVAQLRVNQGALITWLQRSYTQHVCREEVGWRSRPGVTPRACPSSTRKIVTESLPGSRCSFI